MARWAFYFILHSVPRPLRVSKTAQRLDQLLTLCRVATGHFTESATTFLCYRSGSEVFWTAVNWKKRSSACPACSMRLHAMIVWWFTRKFSLEIIITQSAPIANVKCCRFVSRSESYSAKFFKTLRGTLCLCVEKRSQKKNWRLWVFRLKSGRSECAHSEADNDCQFDLLYL